MKVLPITERVPPQFRTEPFKRDEHAGSGRLQCSAGQPDFGKARITVSAPRQMQFAPRLSS